MNQQRHICSSNVSAQQNANKLFTSNNIESHPQHHHYDLCIGPENKIGGHHCERAHVGSAIRSRYRKLSHVFDIIAQIMHRNARQRAGRNIELSHDVEAPVVHRAQQHL